jgi:acid phosphatase family membrane protein YuiD
MGVKLGLILWEEYRLRVFENRVLRGIFGHKRYEATGGWANCIMRSFIIFIFLARCY